MSDHQELPPTEPQLDGDDIQGNVVPGFMKANLTLLAMSFGEPANARVMLGELAPQLTTAKQAMSSRLQVRQARSMRPTREQVGVVPPGVDDVFVNVAFSFAGLARLLDGADSLIEFADVAFQLGLPARSSLLGDPTDPSAEGHVENWVVGGPAQDLDLLIIVAADRDERMTQRVLTIKATADRFGLTLLHEDVGAKFDTLGTEHFGFQDGVSQPGVRGYIDGEFVTPRELAEDNTPDCWLYGLPGQLLVWPGEFVFGHPAASADPLLAGAVALPGPRWSRNGSYLVFRRLRQDVNAFWSFVRDESARLRSLPGFEDWDEDRLAAALVGRWKSGAPLVRAPRADNEALGRDRQANNSFGYAKDAESLQLKDGQTTGPWPEAKADPVGLVCPLASHIRKVNSREAPNDLGASRASLDRRILRRGIPFGAHLTDPTGEDPSNGDRGLLFLSYQTSIENQFEFLNTRWMGSRVNPRSPGGHDMVVGQNGHPGEGRRRVCVLFGSALQQTMLSTVTDFVVPTGGGYFFSPSISALRDTLSVPRRDET